SSKAAIDSTRVSADQLVQQLLADNKLAEALSEEAPFGEDGSALGGLGGGLALYVGKDGSATIGSRTARQVAAGADDGAHHHGSMTFVAVRGSGSGSGSASGSRNSSGSSTPNRKLNRV